MIAEILLIGVILFVLFGDYMRARASLLHEQAREKELENDRKELRDED
jgi:hypothetical protein